MKKIVLLAAVLILCVSGAAYAQTTMPVFCGDLAQEDCDLLTRSQEAMSTLDSAGFGYALNINLSNMPDMPEMTGIQILGDGKFSGASSVMGDISAMESDPGQALLGILDNLNFEFSMTLLVPPELMSELDASIPSEIGLKLSLVDGVGYLDLDTLEPLLGDLSETGMSGWVGLDLAGLVRALMEQMPDLFSGMSSGMSASMMDSAAMQAYIEQFSDPDFLNQFATIEKIDVGMPDETTFRITVDFGALMSSPEFSDMMREMMREQIEAQGQTLSDDEMEQALAMSTDILQNMVFTVDETIGNEDAYVHAVYAEFTLDMASMMAAMDTGSKSSTSDAAPVINVNMTLFYNSFNSVPTITAPEDATVIPYESILGMLSGMSGMMEQQSS